jgi:hypothetical protein
VATKHDPLDEPIARNGRKLSDQAACEPLSCRDSWHRGCQGKDATRFHAAMTSCDRLPARPADSPTIVP